MLQQFVDAGIVLQIDPGERHPVARQKFADTMRVFRKPRTDHPRSDEAGLFEHLAAHQESAQQDIAQLRHVTQDAAQIGGRDLVNLAVAVGDAADDRRAAGEHVDVAGELAGSVRDNELVGAGGAFIDADLAALDDEELEVALAEGEQRLARLERVERRELVDRRDLRLGQNGECDCLFVHVWVGKNLILTLLRQFG